jgi:Nuclease-related domain
VDPETGPEANGTGPAAPAAPASPAETRGQARGELVRARPVLDGLVGDPRLPIWIARAVMALAGGIAITLWQGWRLGLTAAAVITVADTIYRSRTTSVVPAAVMVTSAQRRTRRRLFMLRPAGYVSLHRRAIPGSDSVIDHLVIGPGGVFAVDSERWDRRLPVRSTPGELLYHGPYSQKDRLKHARWEAAQASDLLSEALGETVSVRPAMAIYGPTVPWIVANLDGVDVFGGRRVRKYFRRQTRTSRGARLDSGQIEDIHVAAALALPPTR